MSLDESHKPFPWPPPEERRCTATSKGTGVRCEQWSAGPGIRVCHYHGGGAPQVIAAAKERILQAVDPVLAELIRIARHGSVEADRVRAARDVLDRAGLEAKKRLEVTGLDDGPLNVNVTAAETLASRIAGLAARVREDSGDSKPE